MTFFNFSTYQIPDKKDISQIDLTSDLVIVVNEDAFANEERNLLKKILAAVGKDLEQSQVILLKNERNVKLSNPLNSENLLLIFGIKPLNLGLQISQNLYRQIKMSKKTYIFSQSLKNLPTLREDRRSLWQVLKAYYNIE